MLICSHFPFFFLDLSVQSLDCRWFVSIGNWFDFEAIEDVFICSLLDTELLSERRNASFRRFCFIFWHHVLLQKCVHQFLRTVTPLQGIGASRWKLCQCLAKKRLLARLGLIFHEDMCVTFIFDTFWSILLQLQCLLVHELGRKSFIEAECDVLPRLVQRPLAFQFQSFFRFAILAGQCLRLAILSPSWRELRLSKGGDFLLLLGGPAPWRALLGPTGSYWRTSWVFELCISIVLSSLSLEIRSLLLIFLMLMRRVPQDGSHETCR